MLQRNKRDVTKANGNYSRQRSSKKGVERVARPIKEGIEYFSTYVTHFSDMKIKRLIRSKGNRAIGIMLNVYTKVFDTSYYAEFNEDLSFIISDELREDEAFVNSVIMELAELSIIDKNLLIKYGIITSEVIQDAYFMAIGRRKQATLITELMLKKPEQYFDNSKKNEPEIIMISLEEANSSRKINVNNNLVHVNNVLTQTGLNEVNVNNMPTLNHFNEVPVSNNKLVNVSNNSINDYRSTQSESDSEIQNEIQNHSDSESDIGTVVASDETTARINYLKKFFESNPLLGAYRENTQKEILEFDNLLSVEVVNYALEKTATKHKKYGYARTMLQRWADDPDGPIKTIEQVQAFDQIYYSNEAEKAKTPLRVAPLNEQDVSQGLPF